MTQPRQSGNIPVLPMQKQNLSKRKIDVKMKTSLVGILGECIHLEYSGLRNLLGRRLICRRHISFIHQSSWKLGDIMVFSFLINVYWLIIILTIPIHPRLCSSFTCVVFSSTSVQLSDLLASWVIITLLYLCLPVYEGACVIFFMTLIILSLHHFYLSLSSGSQKARWYCRWLV